MFKLNLKILFIIIILLFSSIIFSSCTAHKQWLLADIVYNDDSKEKLLICINKRISYSYIKAKKDCVFELYPAVVKQVIIGDIEYISVHFDSSIYGIDSYSFALHVAGEKVKLVDTKYLYKPCSCNKFPAIYRDYFLVYDKEILRVDLEDRSHISNLEDVRNFISDKLSLDVSSIYDMPSLSYFLNHLP